jgi:hypothetical protein
MDTIAEIARLGGYNEALKDVVAAISNEVISGAMSNGCAFGLYNGIRKAALSKGVEMQEL